MTIEQILEMSANQLEKMTDAEANEYFKQYFPVTRPELAIKPEKHNKILISGKQKHISGVIMSDKQKRLAKGLEVARQLGMEI